MQGFAHTAPKCAASFVSEDGSQNKDLNAHIAEHPCIFMNLSIADGLKK